VGLNFNRTSMIKNKFPKMMLISTLIFSVMMMGCATSDNTNTQRDKKQNEDTTQRDDFIDKGKTADKEKSAAKDEAITIPTLAEAKENKVALILGPGGYKSFAHLGVLKEFKKANIPIHKVVGIEWGALVGALYAQKGQVHELEWKLFKLEKVDFGGSGFFSNTKGSYDTKEISEYLSTNIDRIDINQTKIKFDMPILSLQTGTVFWPQSGALKNGVESAIAAPPIFKARGDQMAGLFSVGEAARRLAREGYNIIVYVDLLSDGPIFDKGDRKSGDATAALWTEARRNAWAQKDILTDWVSVSTRGIKVDDFESRKLLITAGEAAGSKSAQDMLSKYGF
jgi:NTE family protein